MGVRGACFRGSGSVIISDVMSCHGSGSVMSCHAIRAIRHAMLFVPYVMPCYSCHASVMLFVPCVMSCYSCHAVTQSHLSNLGMQSPYVHVPACHTGMQGCSSSFLVVQCRCLDHGYDNSALMFSGSRHMCHSGGPNIGNRSSRPSGLFTCFCIGRASTSGGGVRWLVDRVVDSQIGKMFAAAA